MEGKDVYILLAFALLRRRRPVSPHRRSPCRFTGDHPAHHVDDALPGLTPSTANFPTLTSGIQLIHGHIACPRPHSLPTATQLVHGHTARPRPHSSSTATQLAHGHTAHQRYTAYPRRHGLPTATQLIHGHTARQRYTAYPRRHGLPTATQLIHGHIARTASETILAVAQILQQSTVSLNQKVNYKSNS